MNAAMRAALAALAVTAMLAASGAVQAAPRAADPLEGAKAALRTRDFGDAMARLQQAAGSGNAGAELLLGLVYLNGVGTSVDKAAAESWLGKSAAQNNATAAYVLAALLSSRADAPPGAAQAQLHKAATLGYPAAIEDERAGRLPLSPDWAGASDTTLRTELAIYSARNGDLACLRSLGTGLKDLRDAFGATLLAHAAEAGALPAVQYLLDGGSDVNRADSFGVTPLMHAAELADPQVLALLLTRGAAVNAADHQRRTALFYAARADRAANVAALAKAGATLDAADSRDYSALDAALTVDADQAAAQLRALGAKTLVAHASRESRAGKFDAARPGDIYRGWPPIALAVARGDSDSVQRLLAGGADPDSRSPQGDTLLHIA
ncbi:MAG: ankyrin repeat domain-containing protein, partial [Gammaproteobacteria bacterium]|nr:ankyrin repeat domain-containing protein [Gammaproteobacteria bacterium]